MCLNLLVSVSIFQDTPSTWQVRRITRLNSVMKGCWRASRSEPCWEKKPYFTPTWKVYILTENKCWLQPTFSFDWVSSSPCSWCSDTDVHILLCVCSVCSVFRIILFKSTWVCCVEGSQQRVTSLPSSTVQVRLGDDATLQCPLLDASDTTAAPSTLSWYRKAAGQGPQLLLSFRSTNSSNMKYGTGVDPEKVSAAADGSLLLRGSQRSDSAVYYCSRSRGDEPRKDRSGQWCHHVWRVLGGPGPVQTVCVGVTPDHWTCLFSVYHLYDVMTCSKYNFNLLNKLNFPKSAFINTILWLIVYLNGFIYIRQTSTRLTSLASSSGGPAALCCLTIT